MTTLSARIKPIMKTAVEWAGVDSVVNNAFPDYPHCAPYLRKLCINAAEHFKDEVVAKRLKEDEAYFNVFKLVVRSRSLVNHPLY